MELQRYMVGVAVEPNDEGPFVRFEDVPKPPALLDRGWYLSSSVDGDVFATAARVIESDAFAGVHLEQPWRLIERRRGERNFTTLLRLHDMLEPQGKTIWWLPNDKTFGVERGCCPEDFTPFLHSVATTGNQAWMAPMHTEPACVDAYCELLAEAKDVLRYCPAVKYVESTETAQGNRFPSAAIPALTAAWLRKIDALASLREIGVQPLLCLNSYRDLSTLKEKARERGLGQSTPDAVDAKGTEGGALQPFCPRISLPTVKRIGMQGAYQWCVDHSAVASTIEDWMPEAIGFVASNRLSPR